MNKRSVNFMFIFVLVVAVMIMGVNSVYANDSSSSELEQQWWWKKKDDNNPPDDLPRLGDGPENPVRVQERPISNIILQK